ncbi:oxidoreductase [Streptomyces virginiae]|uniref:Oxidoreductase n=1 Tax=Streptomyces virginiae TaxID=1961 RepID=A0ABQ3P0P5_STRVG|nr:oxidoreductase [Streptomyces virginiae]MBP2344202.1 aryl-alcohol dehydrogenase-like predicted oxidoreductase [Streptomyces virginiae]GGP92113.1 oxidoreductase [Streptomyces virginiae]GHI18595.1 oxidoreductase [Streptomyces virginiae]
MESATVTAATAGSWKLGDLEVNRLGYGTMRLTGNGMGGNSGGAPIDRGVAVGILRGAVERGVNHIDTASFYFSPLRSANELINRALAPYPDDLVIVTKVGPGRDPSGEWLGMAGPGQLRGQVEENLRQLGRDHLDVVNLRLNGVVSLAEHFGALAELREAGLVRHLGLSCVNAVQLAEAQAIAPVVCVQNPYGLEQRTADTNGVMESCRRQGIAFVPFFSLSGLRREAPADDDHTEELRAVARAHGATPAQIRLAWTLHRGPNVLAIPGTSDPGHLAENIAAGALRLSREDMDRLEPVPAPAPVPGSVPAP